MVHLQVWPYEESDEFGFIQGLFRMMCVLFSKNPDYFTSKEATRFTEVILDLMF